MALAIYYTKKLLSQINLALLQLFCLLIAWHGAEKVPFEILLTLPLAH